MARLPAFGSAQVLLSSDCTDADSFAQSVGGEAILTQLEVTRLLGGSEGDLLLLVLGETSAGSLRQLGAEIQRGVGLLLVSLLGRSTALLVENSQGLGDRLSDNLKKQS